MKITEQEVKLIAGYRLGKNKKLNWGLRYSYCLYIVGAFMIAMAISLAFIQDKGYSLAIFITVCSMVFIAYGLYILWYYKVKRPYINKFTKIFKDTGELIDSGD